LARALYGQPRLLVLDEPNANLDDAGERALVQALGELRQRGVTVLVISHRPNLISSVDRLVLLQAGQIVRVLPASQVKVAPAKAPNT
jgi:ATP-binding cassette subfamily C exporter for protease/lipase